MPRRWSDKRREQPRSRSLEPQRPSPAVGDAHDESPRKTGNFGPDPRMEALDITGACPRTDTDVSDWATTEAREKGSGTPFAAATPSAHPPYDSHPIELALRMGDGQRRASRTSATRECGRVHRAAGTAAVAVVRALDGAARTRVPMRSRSAMVQVRIATLAASTPDAA